MQRTLALIKPDAYAAGRQDAILERIHDSGLRPVATKKVHLTRAQAEIFYHVHVERSFFADLVTFMSEGPVLAMVLEGDNAIARWRDLMGPTDAKKASPGTIRGDFGTNVERNATHGSDGVATAAFEVGFFFSGLELAGL